MGAGSRPILDSDFGSARLWCFGSLLRLLRVVALASGWSVNVLTRRLPPPFPPFPSFAALEAALNTAASGHRQADRRATGAEARLGMAVADWESLKMRTAAVEDALANERDERAAAEYEQERVLAALNETAAFVLSLLQGLQTGASGDAAAVRPYVFVGLLFFFLGGGVRWWKQTPQVKG